MAKTATVYAPADWTPEKGAQARADLAKAPTTLNNYVAKGVANALDKEEAKKAVADSLGQMQFKNMTADDIYRYGIGMPDEDEARRSTGMKKCGRVKSIDCIALRGKTRAKLKGR